MGAVVSNDAIGISYEVALGAIDQLIAQTQQVESLLGDLTTVESALSEDIWSGSDAEFFRGNFPDFKEKMNIIAEDITGIKNWVDFAIQQFQANESRNANAVAEAMSGMRA